MKYEKLAKYIKQATPDKRLIKLDLTEADIEKLKTASQIALGVIGILGITTITVAAPNVLTALHKAKKFVRASQRWNHKEKQRKVTQIFYYLKRTGQIKITPEADRDRLKLHLTEKGKMNLDKASFKILRIPKPQTWDGKWWLVAADIPTKEYRLAADNFRAKIKQMGFYPLQRTLWLYPHNPVNEIELTANYFGIGRFVTVMQVNKLDQDDEKKLREFFAGLI